MSQKKDFTSQAQFNEYMRLAHMNDNPHGILSDIYEDDYPHPYFDPDKFGFYPLRSERVRTVYTDRTQLPNKSIIFQEKYDYIPYRGFPDDPMEEERNSPLKQGDYFLHANITEYDNELNVPHVYNNPILWDTVKYNKDTNLLYPHNREYMADVTLDLDTIPGNLFYNLAEKENLLDKIILNEHIDFIDEEDEERYKLPVTDYQNSWVSVITEKVVHNNMFFLTECVSKALLGKRPFIVLAGQNYLKSLRDIGFKTFDPVIDEEYDTLESPFERYMVAFDAFKRLPGPQELYTKLQDILDYNFDLITDKTKLNKAAIDFLEDIRLNKL